MLAPEKGTRSAEGYANSVFTLFLEDAGLDARMPHAGFASLRAGHISDWPSVLVSP
jgi:hypothetical protein